MIGISSGKYTLLMLTILYIYQQGTIHKGRFHSFAYVTKKCISKALKYANVE